MKPINNDNVRQFLKETYGIDNPQHLFDPENLQKQDIERVLQQSFSISSKELLMTKREGEEFEITDKVILQETIRLFTGLTIRDDRVYIDIDNENTLQWYHGNFSHIDTLEDIAKEINSLLSEKHQRVNRLTDLQRKVSSQELDLNREGLEEREL